MKKSFRNTLISIFVILWFFVFHYESLRAFYLTPLVGPLPKLHFLFPPAGWIMFYEVGDSWSTAEVYGLRPGEMTAERIDPHRIFTTRFVGFDNIHRNIMVNAISDHPIPQFCSYLKRKFPEYTKFGVVLAGYSTLTKENPPKKRMRMLYEC